MKTDTLKFTANDIPTHQKLFQTRCIGIYVTYQGTDYVLVGSHDFCAFKNKNDFAEYTVCKPVHFTQVFANKVAEFFNQLELAKMPNPDTCTDIIKYVQSEIIAQRAWRKATEEK